MSKKKKIYVGSVLKGQNGKMDYIKVNSDCQLTKGQYLNLETKESQINDLREAASAGKLTEDYVQERIKKIEESPDWVRFTITTLVDA